MNPIFWLCALGLALAFIALMVHSVGHRREKLVQDVLYSDLEPKAKMEALRLVLGESKARDSPSELDKPKASDSILDPFGRESTDNNRRSDS